MRHESVHIFGTVLFKQSTDILLEMDGKRIKSDHHTLTSQQQRQRYFTWKGWKKKGYSFTSKQQRDRDILHGKDGKRKGIHPFTSKQQREIFYRERIEKEGSHPVVSHGLTVILHKK